MFEGAHFTFLMNKSKLYIQRIESNQLEHLNDQRVVHRTELHSYVYLVIYLLNNIVCT